MIAVRIPNEIRKYKEKVVFGLNLRQLISTSLAIAVCVPLYLFGRKYIPDDLLSWIIIFIAFPLLGIGWCNYHGMTFFMLIKAKFKQDFLYPSKRIFKTANCFREWQNEAATPKNRKKDKKLYLEKLYLMGEADRNGTKFDSDAFDAEHEQQGKGPKKHNNKRKKDKKKVDIVFIFEKQAKDVLSKMENDPHYIPTRREKNVVSLYKRQCEKKQLMQVKRAKAEIFHKNKLMEHRRYLKPLFIPKSTQETIPYLADFEEGLFEVEPGKYSKVFILTDINYQVAQENDQETIFYRWGEFLNYFNEDVNLQLCIDNRVVSAQEQEIKVFKPMQNDKYDVHRREINRIMKHQMVIGRNNIIQQKYIVVTIDSDSPYEALVRFHRLDGEVIQNLRKIGSNGHMLSTEERLSMLHDKFRKGREGELKIDFDFIKTQGISTKDYIAPTSFYFSPNTKNYFMIEDQYYRCLYLNNLPASLTDELLADLTNCDFPLITTLNIQPVAQDRALKLVRHQLTGMEANKIEQEKKAMKAGYSPETISHDLKQSLSQAEELLDDMLNKNQKMFFVTISFMVNGKSLQELQSNCDLLINKARKYTCQVQCFSFQQEDAFRITLPMGIPPKNISVDRTLTTESTSIFLPFTSQELFQEGGFYYGLNQISRNLILCNRLKLKTPSGFILGSAGSGKSFAAKREMLNVLLNDNTTGLLIIDPENEYCDFARAFGGTVIKISEDTENYINLMDMGLNYGLDDNDDVDKTDMEKKKAKALSAKSDYLMSIIECMISVDNKSCITPQQKTIVDRCVRRCYQNYLDHDFDSALIPTLLDLQEEFDKEKTSEDGRKIAEGVEYYTKGSMNIFSHNTNVDYSNRFVVFSIRDLGSQLEHIALLVVLDFIWNRMIANFMDEIRTYCYVDEIHVLFQNDYSARFLRQLYKRGRKFGLIITGITQNVEDCLKSEMARGMIGNSDFILMLSQSPEDLKILADMLHISEAQMSYISKADPGSGLLFADKVVVPFVDQFPEESYLYTLMSTKFAEMNKNDVTALVNRLISQSEASASSERKPA